MNDKQLLKIVTGFRRGIIGRGNSHLKCFMISAPLHSFLDIMGIHTEIIKGYITMPPNTGWGPSATFMCHYWLKLSDGRILDCTVDQFNKPLKKDMPAVYLGEKPTWFMQEKKKRNKTSLPTGINRKQIK